MSWVRYWENMEGVGKCAGGMGKCVGVWGSRLWGRCERVYEVSVEVVKKCVGMWRGVEKCVGRCGKV